MLSPAFLSCWLLLSSSFLLPSLVHGGVSRRIDKGSNHGFRGNNAREGRRDERKLQKKVDANVPVLNVLVCLMQWTNHPDRDKAVPPEHYEAMLNNQGRDSELYPGGTVKDYFSTISYGDFTMNFVVSPWIMTDFTEQAFTADGSQGRTEAIQAAFEPVLQWLDDDMFDFRDFDTDFDRTIDLTLFLHSGYEGTDGNTDCETGKTSQERVASHARTGAESLDWVSSGGYRLGPYVVAPAFDGFCNTKISRIGTIIHELIHTFAIPEMYDTGDSFGTGNIGGLDRFGVMANPSGNAGGDLAWPGHPAAWTRIELGWVDPIKIDKDGTYEVRPVEEFPDIYKITKGFKENEYLLIENRQPIAGGFDERFFSPGGIAVYHVDENIWDTFENSGPKGNFPRGGPFQDGWPGNGRHYPVALLQADGLYELEQGINGGQSADLWNNPSQVLGPGNGENVASSANYPNTDSYAFGQISPTGLTLKNFRTKPGTNTLLFDVCGFSGNDCPDTTELPGTDPPTNVETDPPTNEDPPTDTTDIPTNGSPIAPQTVAPTAAPSIPPTKAPTRLPTEQPTKTPTQEPSSTPSSFPSSLPTPVIRLENAECEVAANTFASDTPKTISNLTEGKMSETCSGENREGVWYKMDAQSVSVGEVIQATTCFSETNTMSDISVFRGGNCSDLECVEVDRISCKNGELGHSAYWPADSNGDYYLLVHSLSSGNNTDVLDIETFSDGALLLDVLNFPMVENDSCSAAIGVSSDGFVVSGTTQGARPASFGDLDDGCGVESAGVWFKVKGTGSSLQATTCLSGTNHPTQIHVFSGNCTSLSCISVESRNSAACSDSTAAENSATVNFKTEVDTEYLILVGSADGSTGNFELKISEFSTASNDKCVDAIPFSPGQKNAGSTLAATNDFPYGDYCGVPLDTAGVWYEIEGTGKGLSFSTCSGNNYESAISIFTGSSCDKLQCLTGVSISDSTCDFKGVTAAWSSSANTTYRVYVHGKAPNSYGNFELSTEEFDVLEPNAFCNEATAITGIESTLQGSTENATHAPPTITCDEETNSSPGLWYTFDGTGYPFEIDGCHQNGKDDESFDVSFSLYSGDSCGELSCVAGTTFNDQFCAPTNVSSIDTRFLAPENTTSTNTSATIEDAFSPNTAVVDSEIGVTYYLFLHGSGDSSDGAFDITIRSLAPPTAAPTEAPKRRKINLPFNPNYLYSLLLLLFIFIAPPLYFYRRKICCCCYKEESSEEINGSPDVDLEQREFHDEPERSREKSDDSSSKRISSRRKHRWQTL